MRFQWQTWIVFHKHLDHDQSFVGTNASHLEESCASHTVRKTIESIIISCSHWLFQVRTLFHIANRIRMIPSNSVRRDKFAMVQYPPSDSPSFGNLVFIRFDCWRFVSGPKWLRHSNQKLSQFYKRIHPICVLFPCFFLDCFRFHQWQWKDERKNCFACLECRSGDSWCTAVKCITLFTSALLSHAQRCKRTGTRKSFFVSELIR